ncbi:MAG: hypothetical protein WCC36_00260, partial [Gammaproteobacteria bacterium]
AAPDQPQYRINLIKVQIYVRHFDAARKDIANLERLNRYGRLDNSVSRLRKRLAKAEATPLARGPEPLHRPQSKRPPSP